MASDTNALAAIALSEITLRMLVSSGLLNHTQVNDALDNAVRLRLETPKGEQAENREVAAVLEVFREDFLAKLGSPAR